MTRAFEASRALFSLDTDTLATLDGTTAIQNNVQRGYLKKGATGGGYDIYGIGCEDEKCLRDREEDPSLGSEQSEKHFPNIWPPEDKFPRHHRETLVDLFSRKTMLARVLS